MTNELDRDGRWSSAKKTGTDSTTLWSDRMVGARPCNWWTSAEEGTNSGQDKTTVYSYSGVQKTPKRCLAYATVSTTVIPSHWLNKEIGTCLTGFPRAFQVGKTVHNESVWAELCGHLDLHGADGSKSRSPKQLCKHEPCIQQHLNPWEHAQVMTLASPR